MAEYNFSAEKHYIECQLKLNKNFAITDQLLKMLDKYKQLPNDQLQDIILDLGFCFWKKKEIIEESLNYFLRAVEIDPKARCFLVSIKYADVMKFFFFFLILFFNINKKKLLISEVLRLYENSR